MAKDKNNKAKDVAGLRRTATEVKKYVFVTRILSLLIIILVAVIAIAYAISYFYDKFGGFTVRVSKYDMVNQSLSLSETPDFDHTISLLNADMAYDMTNISGKDLPDNIDMINGPHNGANYIAYTFYLINAGQDTLSYEKELYVENVSNNVDEAIRVAVYCNGEKTVYGKTKSNGTGMESDCDKEFLSGATVLKETVEGFAPKAKDKYTVVIWLEGNNPDCVDAIIGGKIKFGMDFRIVETT